MGVRGRKTVGDKVVALRALTSMTLPPPPRGLSKAAKQEWREIVATYPPDRFPRGTWPMLENYCTHAVEARKITARVNKVTEETPLSVYNTLLLMLDRETKAVASFGVRLGIARTSMSGRHNDDPDQVRDTNLPWEE